MLLRAVAPQKVSTIENSSGLRKSFLWSGLWIFLCQFGHHVLGPLNGLLADSQLPVGLTRNDVIVDVMSITKVLDGGTAKGAIRIHTQGVRQPKVLGPTFLKSLEKLCCGNMSFLSGQNYATYPKP
jgi:hypothetical protein